MKNNKVFRQAFVVRSSKVGPDKVASIETLANLFQVKPQSKSTTECMGAGDPAMPK